MVITRHSLRLAAEAYRMQGLLAQRGINVLTIKGATVAQQVYGDLAVRHSKDIDFVVMPDEVDAALAVIAEAGYTRIHPSATLSDPKFWQHYVRVRKECEFIDATRRMQLELHWRLTDNPLLFPVPPRSSWQPIALTSTMTLTGLSRDELFLYLCVHGTGHGWMRLKWLADIAAILARDDSDGAARLYAFAQARGLARCVAPALLLCHSLLNAPLPEDLVARLSDDRINRWLVTVAERLLTSGDASAEILDQPFGTTMVSASHLLLRREWRYRLAELRNMLTFDEDFLLLPLPPPLFFLYPALRLPLWAWRRARYQGRSRS